MAFFFTSNFEFQDGFIFRNLFLESALFYLGQADLANQSTSVSDCDEAGMYLYLNPEHPEAPSAYELQFSKITLMIRF